MTSEVTEQGASTETTESESREAFYADDKIWQHEYCGTECTGEDHA